MPDAGRPVRSRLHSCERSRGGLGLGQLPGAERERRRVMLGDVQLERLADAHGQRVDLGELALGRRPGRPRAISPATRHSIASAWMSVSPSSSASSRASDSIASVRSKLRIARATSTSA